MKTIRQGDVTPWWVGKYGKCWKCDAIVQLERSDTPEVHEREDLRDDDSATVTCPTNGCDQEITVTSGMHQTIAFALENQSTSRLVDDR